MSASAGRPRTRRGRAEPADRDRQQLFALEPGVAQVVEHTGRGVVVARDVPHAGIAPPPGEELFRFATVNDVHIGLEEFGFWPTVHDPLPHVSAPPSERCLRAAVTEAVAWGAQLLVAKGDITQHGDIAEAETAIRLLQRGGVPVEAIVGNHEVAHADIPLRPVFAPAGIDLVQDDVRAIDLPGFRLVLFDSSKPGRHTGTYARHAHAVVDAVGEVATPAVVLTHHHPQPLPVPHHWPPGVPSPEARRFFERVTAANRRVLLSTGHTHRHRRVSRAGVVVTEVGSPQHYPGTWAGYVVHEGGIRQVVRRVAAPDALAWTEATRRSVLRVWARWSPGDIAERCFTHRW